MKTYFASFLHFKQAFAKLCGGYAHVSGGNACEALHCLTGWPTFKHSLKGPKVLDHDLLWSMLLSAFDSGQVLCASTVDDKHACARKGLLESHAYAVTIVCELTDPFPGNVVRLLRLRNPHGRGGGWKGDWGEKSSKWNPELKSACQALVHRSSGPGIGRSKWGGIT